MGVWFVCWFYLIVIVDLIVLLNCWFIRVLFTAGLCFVGALVCTSV